MTTGEHSGVCSLRFLKADIHVLRLEIPASKKEIPAHTDKSHQTGTQKWWV